MNADSLLPLRHALAQRFAPEESQADGRLEIHRRRVRRLATMMSLAVLVLCLNLSLQAQPFNAATYNLRLNLASDGPERLATPAC